MYGSHSIHPSSTTYLGLGHKGSSPSKETQKPVFKVTSSSSSRGTLSRMPWAYTSGPYPGRTCPNHLSWVLSMWKNRNSILSALQMAEFLTPPWGKAQPPFADTSSRNEFSPISFIWSLSNTHDHMWGWGHRSTDKSAVCQSPAILYSHSWTRNT